jgi:hypothetical protein
MPRGIYSRKPGSAKRTATPADEPSKRRLNQRETVALGSWLHANWDRIERLQMSPADALLEAQTTTRCGVGLNDLHIIRLADNLGFKWPRKNRSSSESQADRFWMAVHLMNLTESISELWQKLGEQPNAQLTEALDTTSHHITNIANRLASEERPVSSFTLQHPDLVVPVKDQTA